ncbi:MAG: GGDEF domain-containing protein [Rubrivivax sp.]
MSAPTPPLRILCVADQAPALPPERWGPFELQRCSTLAELSRRLAELRPDAIVVQPQDAAELVAWPSLSQAVLDTAVVVLLDTDADVAVPLLQLGVQDVLPPGGGEALARTLRLAVQRKRQDVLARKAFATDLATGLPNHTQLLEHMTHLLALREREPAPMALIVLRVEGLQRTADTLGVEAANVLRRKVAVRLRSKLRASDVVASIGSDTFAVLLAWIDSPRDGELVTVKMAESLAQPFNVTGRKLTLAVSAGLASYPAHGKDADALLRRALAQASQMATVGTEGLASRFDRGADAAANDEE